MTVTYDETDISTNLAKVRLNIGDVDTTTTTGSRADWTIIFTDEEINAFLARSSNDVNLASAYALRAVAASRAHLAKMVKIGDYTQDTKTLYKGLLEMAQSYEDAVNNTPVIGWAEQSVTDFAYRDIWTNEALRDS